MKELSYTQEFFLCAVKENGNVPIMRAEYVNACILVSALLELIEHGYIIYDENSKKQDKVVVAKEWDNMYPYLEPLYRTISEYRKPKNIKSIAECYVFGGFIQNKPRNELNEAIAVSLANYGCVDVVAGRKKVRYLPKRESVMRVVEKIRAELLEKGNLTSETIVLTALLDRSGLIKKYFSKFEMPELKRRLKEVWENEVTEEIKETLQHIDNIITLIVVIIAAST